MFGVLLKRTADTRRTGLRSSRTTSLTLISCAASMSRSTSFGVRCSRVRTSAFGTRFDVTVRSFIWWRHRSQRSTKQEGGAFGPALVVTLFIDFGQEFAEYL